MNLSVLSVDSYRMYTYRITLDPSYPRPSTLTNGGHSMSPHQVELAFRLDSGGTLGYGSIRVSGRVEPRLTIRVNELWYNGDSGVPAWVHTLWHLLELPEGVTPEALRELFRGPDGPAGPDAPAEPFPGLPRSPEPLPRYPTEFLRPDHRPTPDGGS